MAAHFTHPDDPPRGAHSRRPSAPAGSANPRRGLRTRHGGDESYHAPEGNPHAAGMPHRAEGFVSVVSEPADGPRGHDRRLKEPRFRETDPYDLSGRRSRDPRKRVARVVSVLLFVVGVGLMATAAGMWLHSQWEYAEQDRINDRLAAFADVSTNAATSPQVDWEGLKAVNPEVVGWLQIPGTTVNFPVYQASDNEKYLHTSAEGEYSLGGQVFMDCENTAPGMVDAQTIVYGHHLRNGAMFKPISDMENQEMFDSVNTVWYVTETATYELEPLLLYHTSADDDGVRRFDFASGEELATYLQGLLDKAVTHRADAEGRIASATKVLSLCTCNYDDGDSDRTILVCIPREADTQ